MMPLAAFLAGAGAADQLTDKPGFGDRLSAGLIAANGQWEQALSEQKRITAGGKAADSFREFMGGDDETALGVHDAQWKNFSPREKLATVQTYMQAQQAKEQQARMQQFAVREAEDQTAFQLFKEFTTNNGAPAPAPLAPQYVNPDGTVNERGAAMMAFANVGQNPKAALNARSIGVFQKLMEGAGGKSEDQENPLVFDKESLPGKTVVKTKRGAGFQVVENNPTDRTEMTDYQKALLISRLRQSRAEAARTLAAYKAAPKDSVTPDMISAAQANLDAIDEEMALHGISKPAAGKADAVQPNITQEAYKALKPGETYWWNGKQVTKK